MTHPYALVLQVSSDVLKHPKTSPVFDQSQKGGAVEPAGLLKQKFFGFDSLIPAARTARRLCRIATQNNIV